MKKITILLIVLIGLFLWANAQISDTFIVTPNDVMFKQNEGYDEIRINECSLTGDVGNPQLPVKIISYVLPYNSTVTSIEINSVAQQKLSGNYYIYPAQPPRRLGGSESPPFVEPNPEIYGSSAPVNVLCYFYTLK